MFTCAEIFVADDFSGIYVEHWPNGQLCYRGCFEAGCKQVGTHVYFWENGNVCELAYWRNGLPVGTMHRFFENGIRQLERDYGEDGASTQSWVEKDYGFHSGELLSITVYKNGAIFSEWREPRTQEIWDSIGGDKAVEDFAKRFFHEE